MRVVVAVNCDNDRGCLILTQEFSSLLNIVYENVLTTECVVVSSEATAPAPMGGVETEGSA